MAHPLLPLVLLILFLAVFAVIGYIAYSIAQDIASKTAKKMEDKNIRLSKDGVRVGVKQKDGQQEDAALQSLLVKAWSYSSWPAYKSRFWNKQPQEAPASRKSSTAQFDRRTSAQAERKGS
ncbi:hypothetical protein MMC13_000316 [Lambiella insularis]|nr:hypothetical protein [Lambiella insularis]